MQDLTGWWFLSFTGGEMEWQGQVLRRVSATDYEVQLYEWAMGEPSERRVVAVSDMRSWRFFPRLEWQKEAAFLDGLDPVEVKPKECPRCAAVGEVYWDVDRLRWAILWRKDGEFWSASTGVLERDLSDPQFGCGYDR